MSLFVDTSVWSLLLRRDARKLAGGSRARAALESARRRIFTTGFGASRAAAGILRAKSERCNCPAISALRCWFRSEGHVAAGDLRNLCRRKGAQIGTIDGCSRNYAFATTLRCFPRIGTSSASRRLRADVWGT